MSVLIVSRNVFGKVAVSLAATRYYSVNKLANPICVKHYLHRRSMMSDKRVFQFVARLAYYNEITCSARDGERCFDAPSDDFTDGVIKMCNYYFYEDVGGGILGVHQLVKYLDCILYNIELEGYGASFVNDADYQQYKNDMETLTDIINAINSHIVSFSEEYKNAKWSDL